jgi:hypothetical protein
LVAHVDLVPHPRSESRLSDARAPQLRQCLLDQTAHTALSNGTGSIEERLARWLLMAHDRLGGNEGHSPRAASPDFNVVAMGTETKQALHT